MHIPAYAFVNLALLPYFRANYTTVLEAQLTQKAILLLQDGTVFQGTSIGKIGTTTGEICFNTGMTGYQEVFTDPSYFGQILVMTNDHIGNYGVKQEPEIESESIKIAGVVIKNFSAYHSRRQATESLQDYFAENNLVGIADIDTRELVRHIRQKGAMNAIISSETFDVQALQKKLSEVPDMSGLELSSQVTVSEAFEYGDPAAEVRVALLDLGVKQNILRSLSERGCFIKVFPARSTFSEMEAWKPSGYMISNGPGDPAAMPYAVDTLKEILEHNRPLFGICLGNQVLGLACGLKTYKMFNGHRGLNHPVKNLLTGLCEITSQNHGFAISEEGIDPNFVEVTHRHLNDNTIAGIRIKGKPAFAVQYHPESSPGPHDSRYLFDDFVKMMKEDATKSANRKSLTTN